MQTPTIHLNGTSRNSLVADYRAQYEALENAIECLNRTGPHARDYYVQGNQAFPAASFEHESRIERLRTIRNEVFTILETLRKD